MRPILVGVLFLSLPLHLAQAQGSVRRTDRASRQLIVALGTIDDLDDVIGDTDVQSLGAIPGTTTYLLELPEEWSAWQQAHEIARLRSHASVRHVERNSSVGSPEAAACNLIVGPGAQPCTEAVISDNPTGPDYYDQNLVARLNVPAAQQLLTGYPSLVAVIDTGI